MAEATEAADAALDRVRAAPFRAEVADYLDPETLAELEARPEWGALVTAGGKRKKLTRPEVEARLPLYLEEIYRRLEKGEVVDRRRSALAVGLPYGCLKARTREGSALYDPPFARLEKQLLDAQLDAAEDVLHYLLRTDEKTLSEEGYTFKQANHIIAALRLRRPNWRDVSRIETRHLHLHGNMGVKGDKLLVGELNKLASRFQPPAPVLEATAS